MTIDRGLIGRIRARGEEVFGQLSGELLANPRFMKAIEGALRGREKVEEAVALALRQMNVPTRTELRRLQGRVDTLEREMADLRFLHKRRAAAERAPRKRPAPATAKAAAKGTRARAARAEEPAAE